MPNRYFGKDVGRPREGRPIEGRGKAVGRPERRPREGRFFLGRPDSGKAGEKARKKAKEGQSMPKF